MSGRPITGILRLNTQSNPAGKSMENTLKTARTAATARPVTTATGRFVRLGTVSEKLPNISSNDCRQHDSYAYMYSSFVGINVEYTRWSIHSNRST
jgi:hypothetical protein